jgi:hypothetical protein
MKLRSFQKFLEDKQVDEESIHTTASFAYGTLGYDSPFYTVKFLPYQTFRPISPKEDPEPEQNDYTDNFQIGDTVKFERNNDLLKGKLIKIIVSKSTGEGTFLIVFVPERQKRYKVDPTKAEKIN